MSDHGRFDVPGGIALVTGSTRGLGNVMAPGELAGPLIFPASDSVILRSNPRSNRLFR